MHKKCLENEQKKSERNSKNWLKSNQNKEAIFLHRAKYKRKQNKPQYSGTFAYMLF